MSIHVRAPRFNHVAGFPRAAIVVRAFDNSIPQIAFTYFSLNNNPQGTRYHNDWIGLCDWIERSAPIAATKDELPLIKLATFANDYRSNVTVEMVYGIEGDYDAGLMQPQAAVNRLTAAGVIAFIYTSPSHTPETPKWRVLAPTSQPRNLSERYNLVGRINGILGGVLANESFTDSQSYYVGRLINGHPVQCFRVNGSHYVDTIEGSIVAPPKANGADGRKPLGTDRAPDLPLATIALNSIDPNETDYNEWRNVSFAFRHATTGLNIGELAIKTIWDAWCGRYTVKPNTRADNDKLWRSAAHGTNVGWFYLRHQAIKSGNLTDDQRARMTFGVRSSEMSSQPQQQQPTLNGEIVPPLDGYQNIIATAPAEGGKSTLIETVKLLHGTVNLAFDEFSQSIVATAPLPWDRNRAFPRLWTELDTIHAMLFANALFKTPGKDTVFDAVNVIANRNKFHQVRDYFARLHWDGMERLPRMLMEYFGAQPSPYAAKIGTKFMIGAVARIMHPGCQSDHVLVLEGLQGIQKSTSFRILAGDPWFTDELPDLQSKDAAIQLAGKWIIEVSELSALKRSDVETTKKFMSRRIDRYRAPYERIASDHPRQCVFVATTNDEEYLKDQTGNRRFWPVKCRTINTTALRCDRDQLWAEAFARFNRGEHWWLDAIEERTARDEQEERREIDPWEGRVLAIANATNNLPVTVEHVAMMIGVAYSEQDTRTNKRIAQILQNNGFEKRRVWDGTRRVRKYVKL